MRLIFVTHSLPPLGKPASNIGGMQRAATELDTALNTADGISYRSIAMRSSWAKTHVKIFPFLARTYRKLKREIREENVDAILFSSMVTATLIIWLAKLLKQKSIATMVIAHGLDVTTPIGIYQRAVAKVFQHVDAVFPVSTATADACVEKGLDREKVHVVPNGIDTERFSAPESTVSARSKLLEEFTDLPDDSLLLISVGRHVARKGYPWFIANVMTQLPSNVHYWLAGEGPQTAAIKTAIADNNLGDRVRAIGKISEQQLRLLYAGGDLFIMPNRPVSDDMEGFGIVILEAGLSGTPTIGARLEGICDVITDGVNGHYAETGDAQDFASVIQFYNRDRDALAALSSSAATHTIDTFGWEEISERYLRQIRRVVGDEEVSPA